MNGILDSLKHNGKAYTAPQQKKRTTQKCSEKQTLKSKKYKSDKSTKKLLNSK